MCICKDAPSDKIVTPFQKKNENHTLSSRTSSLRPDKGATPPPPLLLTPLPHRLRVVGSGSSTNITVFGYHSNQSFLPLAPINRSLRFHSQKTGLGRSLASIEDVWRMTCVLMRADLGSSRESPESQLFYYWWQIISWLIDIPMNIFIMVKDIYEQYPGTIIIWYDRNVNRLASINGHQCTFCFQHGISFH